MGKYFWVTLEKNNLIVFLQNGTCYFIKFITKQKDHITSGEEYCSNRTEVLKSFSNPSLKMVRLFLTM